MKINGRKVCYNNKSFFFILKIDKTSFLTNLNRYFNLHFCLSLLPFVRIYIYVTFNFLSSYQFQTHCQHSTKQVKAELPIINFKVNIPCLHQRSCVLTLGHLRSIRGVGRYEILVEHIIKPLLKSGGAICYQTTKKWQGTCPQAPPMVTLLSILANEDFQVTSVKCISHKKSQKSKGSFHYSHKH